MKLIVGDVVQLLRNVEPYGLHIGDIGVIEYTGHYVSRVAFPSATMMIHHNSLKPVNIRHVHIRT